MANTVTMKQSDYTDWLSEQERASEQTDWANLLRGYTADVTALTQQAAQEASSYQSQASYDISSAYANYMKQQLATQYNPHLTTGFKSEISSELERQYGSQYSNIQAQLQKNINKISEQYQKNVGTLTSDFEKQRADYADKLSQVHDWITSSLAAGDTENGIKGIDFMTTDYWTGTPGADNLSMSYTLTPQGQKEVAKFLYGADTKNLENLKSSDEELYNFVMNNQNAINAFYGLETSRRGYDEGNEFFDVDIAMKRLKDKYPNVDVDLNDDMSNKEKVEAINKTYTETYQNDLLNNFTTFNVAKNENATQALNDIKSALFSGTNYANSVTLKYGEANPNYQFIEISLPEGLRQKLISSGEINKDDYAVNVIYAKDNKAYNEALSKSKKTKLVSTGRITQSKTYTIPAFTPEEFKKLLPKTVQSIPQTNNAGGIGGMLI